jgi:hypothetical protein
VCTGVRTTVLSDNSTAVNNNNNNNNNKGGVEVLLHSFVISALDGSA